MRDDLEWRNSYQGIGILQLRNLTPDKILGANSGEVSVFLQHGFLGYDKFGRPIVYKVRLEQRDYYRNANSTLTLPAGIWQFLAQEIGRSRHFCRSARSL